MKDSETWYRVCSERVIQVHSNSWIRLQFVNGFFLMELLPKVHFSAVVSPLPPGIINVFPSRPILFSPSVFLF